MGVFFDSYDAIKAYKTVPTNEPSLLYQRVLKPLALRAVSGLPMWVAPNLLTLMGLVMNGLHYASVAVYTFPSWTGDQQSSIPDWVPLVSALVFFAYIMLDNMDGRQAVRTGATSPFGEFLDHACDSLVAGLGSIVAASFLQIGPWGAFLLSFVGMPAFFSAHWLEYYTDFLDLPKWTGPTEIEAATILMYLFSSWKGVAFWSTPVLSTSVGGVDGVRLGQVVALLASLGAAFTGLKAAREAFEKAAARGRSTAEVWSIALPLLTVWSAIAIWVVADSSIVDNHPHLFLTGLGLVFSYVQIRCIVARMLSVRKTSPIAVGSLPTFMAAGAAVFGVDQYVTILGWWLASFAVLVAISWEIVPNMCNALNIRFLTITPRPAKL